MKPAVEFIGFLSIALGAHLLVWQGSASGSFGAAGQAGSSMVTLAGASSDLQDLVADWDRPPEAALATPDLRTAPPDPSSAPTLPRMQPRMATPAPIPALPVPQMEQPLVADSAPPPPPPPPVKPKPRPRAAPEKPAAPARAAAKPAKAQAGTVTRGSKAQVNTKAGGQNGGGKTATNAKPNPSLMAHWASGIRSSIERRKRYPSGSRAKGAVSLSMAVTTNGALSGLAIAKSSGDAALDRAALEAVKRARLPKAPAGIPAGTHRFTLSVSFAR